MTKHLPIFAILLAAAVISGCDDEEPGILGFKPKPIVLPAPQTKPAVIGYKPLKDVLYRVINRNGYIVAEQYSFVEDAMTQQLQIFSAVGPSTHPEQFKTPADKLAYWYNVRSAWCIKMAMMHHRKSLFGKSTDYTLTIEAMHSTPVPVDGRLMKSADVDKEIFAVGGFMAEMLTPGATLDKAPLPQKPFSASDFPGIYRRRLNDFVNSASRFECNVEAHVWYIPDAIWKYRKQLTKLYQANYPTPEASFLTVLIWWTSGTAEYRLQNYLGYRCERNPRRATLTIISE